MDLNHLKEKHKNSLLILLRKHEEPQEKYRSSNYTKISKPTIREEVHSLIEIGVLKEINVSQWAAPTSIIPEINGTVRLSE